MLQSIALRQSGLRSPCFNHCLMTCTSFTELSLIPSALAEMASHIGLGRHLSRRLKSGTRYIRTTRSCLRCPLTHCSVIKLYLSIADRRRLLLAFRSPRSRFHPLPLVTQCSISQLSTAICSAFRCVPNLSHGKPNPLIFCPPSLKMWNGW